MDPWTALLPLATSGRARGLFVTSKERTKLAPNIPTSDEVGLKDFNISSWYGVWAPKDTPDPIVDKLASAMAEVSKDPGFIEKTTSLGIVPTARGPKDIRRLHQDRGRGEHGAAEGVRTSSRSSRAGSAPSVALMTA